MASRALEFWKSSMAARQRVKDAVSRAEEEQDIFFSTPQGAPDLIYEPSQSSNPSDPRTSGMRYWRDARVMEVSWGDGGVKYAYYDVSPTEARSFIRVKSPGRYINRVLNSHPYGPIE